MKRQYALVLVLASVLVSSVRAEHINVLFDQAFYGRLCLGEGARAWGMGGTSLAMPGDVAAASWNPAGLAILPKASLALSYGHDRLELRPKTSKSTSIIELESSLAGGRLDFAAIAVPLRILGWPVVSGLSYRRRVPYSFNMTYAYQFRRQTYYRFDYDYQYSGEVAGGLDAFSLSLASEVRRGVQLGVNVHRWFNGFTRPGQESYAYSIENFYGWTADWREDLSDRVELTVSGYSLDIGILVSHRQKVFAGLVYRTGASMRLRYANTAEYRNGYTGEVFSGTAAGNGRLSLPASLGAGAAFQASRSVLLAVDYIRTFWSRARIQDYVRAPSGDALPEAADFTYPSLTQPDVVSQKDTDHLHVGMEITLRLGSLSLPLRSGIFADGHYFYSPQGTAVRTTGYTLGLGLRWRRMALDAAWVKGYSYDRYAHDVLKVSCSYGL